MEEPPSRKTKSSSVKEPLSKWKASLTEEKIDVEPFSRVLVIHNDKQGRKKATWFPITFAHNEFIQRTLRIVKSEDLKDVEHPALLPNKILTADTPLEEAEIRFFQNRSVNYYTALLHRLQTLDKIQAINFDIISETIHSLIERCQKSQREFHAQRSISHNKTGAKFNPNYEKDLPLDEIETKLGEKLKESFKKLKYEVYPEINLDVEKFEAFAEIFNILFRSIRVEMNKIEKKWTNLSAKELGMDRLIRRINKKKAEHQAFIDRGGNGGFDVEFELGQAAREIEKYNQILKDLKGDIPFTPEKYRPKAYTTAQYQPFKVYALEKGLPLIQNSKVLIWTQSLNDFNLNKHFWNLLGEEGKIERDWVKSGALIYEDLAKRYYSFSYRNRSDEPKFTLSRLFEIALMSPELCGFIKYLHLLDKEPLKIYTGDPHFSIYRAESFLTLAKEEQRQILIPDSEIDGNEGFVFSLDTSHILDRGGLDQLWQGLRYYTEGLLDHLDLSRTLLTGSAITAAFEFYDEHLLAYYGPFTRVPSKMLTSEELMAFKMGDYLEKMSPEERIKYAQNRVRALFSSSVTIPSDYQDYREIVKNGDYRISGNSLQSKTRQIKFEQVEGADIDLAVLSENQEEFEEIVQAQFARLKKWNPSLKLVKVDRKTALYEISGHSRKIQLYPSSIKQILTHHLAMVRGFVYGNAEDRMIYCSASALYSFYKRVSLNYYYFAGVKSPAEVILKYRQRGYEVELPREILRLLNRYIEENPKWNYSWASDFGNFPALLGYGNFDISDLAHEEASFEKLTGNKFSQGQLVDLLKILFKIYSPGYQMPTFQVPEDQNRDNQDDQDEDDQEDEDD